MRSGGSVGRGIVGARERGGGGREGEASCELRRRQGASTHVQTASPVTCQLPNEDTHPNAATTLATPDRAHAADLHLSPTEPGSVLPTFFEPLTSAIVHDST